MMIRKVKPMCMCMCMCMGGKASTCVQLNTNAVCPERERGRDPRPRGVLSGVVNVKVLLLLLVALAED